MTYYLSTSIIMKLNFVVFVIFLLTLKPRYSNGHRSERRSFSFKDIPGTPLNDSSAHAEPDFLSDFVRTLSYFKADGNDDIPSQIEDTLNLLEEGEKIIQLKDEYKDVILIMGNTGAGKSTFTQWIAGDDDELYAVEVSPGEFLIKDKHGKIGNSTITSQTIFPELVIHNKTNTAYYDLPGFSDTRSSSHDIAASYFIKKVLNHSRSIKMVFIVSYPSLRQGVDRQDFMNLVKQTTEIVKDIDKYENSISIVATKVDNQVVKNDNGDWVLIDDGMVRRGIADFLKQVKADLEERKNFANVTGDDIKFCENAIKFIEVLLRQHNNYVLQVDDSYGKIGLFRRPTKSGPLFKDILIQNEKKNVTKVIQEILEYTIKNDNDFGYTISDKSKNTINDLVDEIDKTILQCVGSIAKEVNVYFQNVLLRVKIIIVSFTVSNNEFVDADLAEAQSLSNMLNEGHEIILELIKNIENSENSSQLSKTLNISLNHLEIEEPRYLVENITRQGDYLQFLQIVTNKEFDNGINSQAWASPFQSIATDLARETTVIKNNVTNMANEVEKMIKSDIIQSIERVKKDFFRKEIEVYDLKDTQKIFLITFEKLTKIQNTENLEPEEYTKVMSYNINLKLTNHTLNNIIENNKYFEFLKNELNNLIDYLEDSQKWYYFLIKLYEQLSLYDIQKDKNICKNLADKINDKDDGKIIAETELESFLIQCFTDSYKMEYDIIKNIKLDNFKLKNIIKVFSLTLNNEIKHYCDNDRMVIRGQFVKLSDVINKSCIEPPKFIEIFALSKVFFDTSFNKNGQKLQLSIIAPTWDIQGDQKLTLLGAPGVVHNPVKASDGTPSNKDGNYGKPGLPGGSGGNFFGIGDIYLNFEKLIISVDGGEGGPGQTGGDGATGDSGGIPKLKITNEQGWAWGDDFIFDREWKQLGYTVNRGKTSIGSGENPNIDTIYYVFGTNCTDGGMGGDGGHGGEGGNPGGIIIIEVSNTSTISISNNIGKIGSHGVSGYGGRPGNVAEMIEVKKTLVTAVGLYQWASYRVLSSKKLTACVFGNRGTGLNKNDILEPDNVIFLHQFQTVNNYKTFLRENLNSIMKESFLRDFMNKIENNTVVQDLYDVSAFFDELIDLENQLGKLEEWTSILPFYKSLLNRVDEHIAKKCTDTDCLQNQTVLLYLRVAIMSKICSVINNLENYFVIDIKEYFNLVERHIEQYKKALKEVKISNYKDQYHSSITTQINEANKLITDAILPDIDLIYETIDNQIKKLIQDIIKQIAKNEETKDKLYELQNKLSSQMVLKVFLGYIKFASQFLIFAGPEGAVAAGVIGAGVDAAGKLIFRKEEIPLVESANRSLAQLINYYKPEQQCLKKYLDNAENGILQNKTSTNEVNLQKLLDIIEPMQKILSLNSVSINDYINKKKHTRDMLHTFLIELTKTQRLQLQSEKYSKIQKSDSEGSEEQKVDETTIGWISIIENSFKIAETGYDVINNVNNDQKVITAVGDSIQKVIDDIKALKEYEEFVYDVMIPMRNNFEEVLKAYEESSNKSHAALDVSKWKIQNIVKDFQTHMQYTFHVSDPIIKATLMASIDKLQGGMLTMIQIYDRIQDYFDKSELVDYLADLNSDSIINGVFKEYIDKLELITKSNLLLQEFDKGTDAFKQYIFPFANLYFDRFEMPPSLQSNNISDLVFKAMTQIGFLQDELIKDATVIKKNDYRLFPDIRFDNTKFEQAPFFVWKHETHKEQISRLLEGKEITIKSDITKGIKQNAIKFREIGVHFILANKTLQAELDDYLSNFLVVMTHQGDSHYKCDDKYVLISHNKISMKHSVNKAQDGVHYYYLDQTSTHIKNNPPMCSPYSTWKIQLLNKDTTLQTYDLSYLKKYAEQVIDLSLEGWGLYVELGIEDICNDNLKKNYDVIDID